MTDTIRTLDQILALLADNTNGDISPQDLRDQTVTLNSFIVAAAALERVKRFSDLATLKAKPSTEFANFERVTVDSVNASGLLDSATLVYQSSDISATFIRKTVSVLTGDIDVGTDKINQVAHGLRTGQGALATGGDGLTPETVVYYIRGRLPNEYTLHPTYEDAVLNTNKVDITGTTAFSLKVLVDPDQSVYCTLTGGALDGSGGGFVREAIAMTNTWEVAWFPASGPDDTAQINRAILAAGTYAFVLFPIDTLVFSNRDNDGVGLWKLSGQHWEGVSRELSILQLSSAVTDIRHNIRSVDLCNDFTITKLCFDGNRDNITPSVDLYSYFNMITGPEGGKRGRYRNIKIINSWGRSLQTGYESGTIFAEDMIVDDVIVLNSGTKAQSLTKTLGGKITNSYSEVNCYTSAENNGLGAASSGSCFESNECTDASICGNKGVQVGATIRGPGLRSVNASGGTTEFFGNEIDGASYLLFLRSTGDETAYNNVGRNIQGNAVLIGDSDEVEQTNKVVRLFNNKIIDPTAAFVVLSVIKASNDSSVTSFIHDNDFIKDAGTPTHGIYNNGVSSPATGGTCTVHAWANNFVGSIPNQKSGPADYEIQPAPNQGWTVVEQSSVAVSHTGDTSETNLAVVTIPAFAMGKNGRLRVTATWSYPNSANNKITRFRWGGSQAYASTLTTSTHQRAQIEIANRNDLAAQVSMLPGGLYGFGLSSSAVSTYTKDTTANVNLNISGALANSGETIVLESYIVEAFYQI